MKAQIRGTGAADRTGMREAFRGDRGIVKADLAGVVVVLQDRRR